MRETLIELEAEGYNSKFPKDVIESEKEMKKKLEALQEKVGSKRRKQRS